MMATVGRPTIWSDERVETLAKIMENEEIKTLYHNSSDAAWALAAIRLDPTGKTTGKSCEHKYREWQKLKQAELEGAKKANGHSHGEQRIAEEAVAIVGNAMQSMTRQTAQQEALLRVIAEHSHPETLEKKLTYHRRALTDDMKEMAKLQLEATKDQTNWLAQCFEQLERLNGHMERLFQIADEESRR